MKRADPFPTQLRAFFYEWMVEQRNASVHTVRSYRDTQHSARISRLR
jgi:hypothetical protein